MIDRLARVTGTVTTAGAGVVIAALSLSLFGASTTFFTFLTLFLLASTTQRALARRRVGSSRPTN